MLRRKTSINWEIYKTFSTKLEEPCSLQVVYLNYKDAKSLKLQAKWERLEHRSSVNEKNNTKHQEQAEIPNNRFLKGLLTNENDAGWTWWISLVLDTRSSSGVRMVEKGDDAAAVWEIYICGVHVGIENGLHGWRVNQPNQKESCVDNWIYLKGRNVIVIVT